MISRWRDARRAVLGTVTIALGLALAPSVAADIGYASFSPQSTSPGKTVLVELQGCEHPAAEIRMALILGDQAVDVDAADDATEVTPEDAAAPGSYRIVVPALEPGRYEVLAACPRDEPFGFWGSEAGLRVTGAPETATITPQPAGPDAPDGTWRALLAALAGILAFAAWLRWAPRRGA